MALAVGLLAPSYAASPAATDPGRGSANDHASDHAQAALDHAQEIAAGHTEGDATLALTQLQQTKDDLPAGEQREAERLLARPGDPGSPDVDDEYVPNFPANHRIACSTTVCVHWTQSGTHQASASFSVLVQRTMKFVWDREIAGLGYKTPLGDGTRGALNGQGTDGQLDVYLGNTGAKSVFGYAVPEQDSRQSHAYMVLDNNFAEFGGNPTVQLRATAAHEFFHVVQFGYDSYEQGWLMEDTATWMEEQVYDEANDNRNYLPRSSLRHPTVSLDHQSVWYGNWVFFQHLSEAYGEGVVKDIWGRAVSRSAKDALRSALSARGTSLADRFSKFSVDSNIPARVYEEGSTFPRAIVGGTWALSTSRRDLSLSTRINHLASNNVVVRPASSLTGRWRVRIRVNGPYYLTRAYALLHRRDGRLGRYPIRINSAGDGSATLVFSRASVNRITLNLANTHPSYTKNNLPFKVRFTAFRG
ncbi:hypothetical protein ASD66_22605 [Nocardioides sp. Root151]|nr:hypothetical protein ASD66_22605 [Nocardioides sp. Root151]